MATSAKTIPCDICGKEISGHDVHSGNGIEDLCFECYQDMYDEEGDFYEGE